MLGALEPGKHRLQSHYFLLAPVFETDKKAKAQTFRGDFLYSLTPTSPRWALGQRRALGKFIGFYWRPYAGFELGNVLDDGGNPEIKREHQFSRFLGKANAQLWFFDRLQLSADYEARQDLEGHQGLRDYWEVNTVLYVNPNDQRFSIGVTYKNGRTTPSFTRIDSFNTWIGLKF